MCQVHDGLLIGGSQILDDELIEVGEGEFYRNIQLARVTFLTVRRDTVECECTRTHLTGIPHLSIETYSTAMQMVRTIIECQLVVLAIQRELTLADTVTPTSNQC